MRKQVKDALMLVARGVFTVCMYGFALFWQVLLAGFTPATARLNCSGVQEQLRSMGITLFLECVLFALALVMVLKLVFGSSGRTTGIYAGLFTLGCCLSAAWFLFGYYKANGC